MIARILRSARNRILNWTLRRLIRLGPCDHLERIGSDYGGWTVPVTMLDSDSICYCGGVGEDLSFDEGLLARFGCRVVAFDPTPRAIDHGRDLARRDARFTLMEVGLWSTDTRLRFYAPRNPTDVSHSIVNLQRTTRHFEAECRSVPSVMAELGHHRLGLLKIDIEGAEHEVLESVLARPVEVPIICVEFDQPSSLRRMLRTVRNLERHGYGAVALERWNLTFVQPSGAAVS